MASTNQTPTYGLPQFVDKDKPGWLTDFNTAMLKIDEAIKAAYDAGGTSEVEIETLKTTVNQLNSTVESITNTVNNVDTKATSAEETASSAQTTANNANTLATENKDNLNTLNDKLLINGNTTEIFTLNPNNNKQLIGSAGHTLNLTSQYLYFSKNTTNINKIVLQKSTSGEFKLYGRIALGFSGQTPGVDSITIISNTAILPTTANFDLDLHGFIQGQRNDLSTSMNSSPTGLKIVNGVFSLSKDILPNTNNAIIQLYDSVITSPYTG